MKVSPGYLAALQPTSAPQKPEHWKDVMQDIEKVEIETHVPKNVLPR